MIFKFPTSKKSGAHKKTIDIEPLPRRELLSIISGEIEKYNESNKNIGLISLKIFSFKNLINNFGFEEADNFLSNTISSIKGILKDQDSIFRSGDDELVIILPNILNEGHIILAASRIQNLFENPILIASKTINIKITMGISLLPEHADDAEDLLLNASIALEEGIQNELPYNIYTSEEKTTQHSNILFEAQLSAAIEANELKAYYQPKIDIKNRTVYGVEALARWNHPEHGLIRPAYFIPFAEKAGLINKLTISMLNTSLKEAREWRGIGANIVVSVNLSATSLLDDVLVENIQRSINLWDASPDNLIFEITESGMMANPDVCLQIMKDINSIGVRCSVDDFGTGYSSLAYLKQMPVAELKIDKSFVLNMLDSEEDNLLVNSIINLAHNFNLSVTAEGVENSGILKQLTGMDCDFAQGYYIGKPMPNEQFKQWMKNSGWIINPV